ncbi:ACT domain-containing protein [Maricaulis sp.]|uniref:ACT domain-containing protein n=1 Tax=Maricaulis sp. TaxID=1486257 RepID=UPI002623EE7E|nr:ACT domain-containing protein [Maricaulis sp.]
MRDTLRIELSDSEGALMRLVGLVERRGFTIATLEKADAADGQSTVIMRLSARDGARSLDVLTRQIGRLFDVRAVFTPELAAAEAAHASYRWRQACPPRN